MFTKQRLFLLFLAIPFLQGNLLYAQNFSLRIKGNTSSETNSIDSIGYQKKHSSYKEVETEADSLLSRLQKNGYIDAERSVLKKEDDSLFLSTFTLHERINQLKVHYTNSAIDQELLKIISEEYTDNYFIIPFAKIENTLTFLNNAIANQGKPFSYLQLTKIRKNTKNELEANLSISQTKKRTLDDIIVKGYEKFPKAFLKNFIRLKKGQAFNKTDIDKKVARLKNLRFAESTRNPEVLFTKDSTTIYLYLKKRNSNLFDGFLGFATDEESGDLEINGNLDLQFVNNLNFGESLAIIYKNDGNEQQRFNATLKLPYLFNTPFGTELNLNLFRKDSTFTTTDQKVKLTYQLNHATTLHAGYRSSVSNYLLDEPPVTGQITEDYQANYVSVGGNYLIINGYNALVPIKTDLNLTLESGHRNRENTTSNQLISQFYGSHIFQLNLRNSIYLYNETSYLQSDDYLENELFRFGGINSLRGFEENSITASFYSTLQTEYRYLLSPNLYAHSIIDFAFTENQLAGIEQNLYGIGFGLGLKTQAGLLKVNFANGKVDDQNFEFRNTKIHLSLVAIF